MNGEDDEDSPCAIEYQTRRNGGEIRRFTTLARAWEDAMDFDVWKLSFNLPDGDRVRLVRDGTRFVFEPLLEDRG